MQTGNSALAAWLASSSKWTTPLHHLDIIPTRRAHALLRKGATVLAAAMPGDPTPLSIARELHAKGKAVQGSAAALVLGWWQLRRLALATSGKMAASDVRRMRDFSWPRMAATNVACPWTKLHFMKSRRASASTARSCSSHATSSSAVMPSQ